MVTPLNNRFISFEGVEGVGKSTQIQLLADWLTKQGQPVIVTREPGGTPLAEEIRELLLAERDEPVPHLAELLLMFSARAVHIENHIIPALKAGHWVLCDRFTDASFAYQGAGRGTKQALVAQLADITHADLWPARTVLLDGDVSTAMQRTIARGKRDRFELEENTFFEKIRAHYLSRAQAEPDRFVVIDALQSIDDVAREIQHAIHPLLKA